MFVVVLSGCVASLYPDVLSVPRPTKIDSFNVGQIQEKTVGEVMLYKITARVYDGFVANNDYSPPGAYGMSYPPIKKGSKWIVYGRTEKENGNFVYAPLEPLVPVVLGSPASWHYCVVVSSQGEVLGITWCHGGYVQVLPEKVVGLFSPEKIYEQTGGFKQEIIYTGKSKDMIKLQYREYLNDLARPSFYQDLIYDLSESSVVGFRGMQVEVMEATNSSIKFIVKTPMN